MRDDPCRDIDHKSLKAYTPHSYSNVAKTVCAVKPSLMLIPHEVGLLLLCPSPGSTNPKLSWEFFANSVI
jgi:hypothetical protein